MERDQYSIKVGDAALDESTGVAHIFFHIAPRDPEEPGCWGDIRRVSKMLEEVDIHGSLREYFAPAEIEIGPKFTIAGRRENRHVTVVMTATAVDGELQLRKREQNHEA